MRAGGITGLRPARPRAPQRRRSPWRRAASRRNRSRTAGCPRSPKACCRYGRSDNRSPLRCRRRRWGEVVLDPREPIQVIIAEDLAVAPCVREGNHRARALVLDALEVGNPVKRVAEVDQLLAERRGLENREERGQTPAPIVGVSSLDAVAVIDLGLLGRRGVNQARKDAARGAARQCPEQTALVVLVTHLVVVGIHQGRDAVHGIVLERSLVRHQTGRGLRAEGRDQTRIRGCALRSKTMRPRAS